jgi:DNA-binding NtrC family response regulator
VSSVLIVDDEPGIRQFLSRWLAPAGYEIREAADADAALAMIDVEVPDVVLCDVQMPGHDGLWLVGQLRERFSAVPVVLATADAHVPPGVSLQNGVVDYLVKPFDRDAVLACVARAVEWRKAAVEREGRQSRSGDPLSEWLNHGRR